MLFLEQLEAREVPTRLPVLDTSVAPWSAVVHIESVFPDGTTGNGGGALISPFHVVTAGHLVHAPCRGGLAAEVRVTPGRDQTAYPFGQTHATVVRTYDSFQQAGQQRCEEGHPEQFAFDPGDISLLTLQTAIGDQTDWFSLATSVGDRVAGTSVQATGYSGVSTGDLRLFHQSGTLEGTLQSGTLLTWQQSSLTVEPGLSGSPLWQEGNADTGNLVGVIVAGDENRGYAVRISDAIFQDFHNALLADAPPGSDPVSSPPTLTGITLHDTRPVSSPENVIGIFDPATGLWSVFSAPGSSAPERVFAYGLPGWLPVVGDWNSDGQTDIGVYDPATATWFLRHGFTPGVPDAGVFVYGAPGWWPIVGDWNGDGRTDMGTYNPTWASWYLRHGVGAGYPDAGVFTYGAPGWLPVVGDWNGDGITGIGVFNPSSATWYLRQRSNAGAADAGLFSYGAPGWLPVVGDWDEDGKTAIGVIDPQGGAHLRTDVSAGAPDMEPFLLRWRIEPPHTPQPPLRIKVKVGEGGSEDQIRALG